MPALFPLPQLTAGAARFMPSTAPAGKPPVVPNDMGRRRTMFGGFINPRNLQVVGHTLQELGGQQGALDQWMQQAEENRRQLEQDSMRRDLFGMQVRGQKLDEQHSETEDAQALQQRQQLETIIGSLPPDQQALARLNPQAYVAGIMRNRYPAPARGAVAGRGTPSLPDGFQWED